MYRKLIYLLVFLTPFAAFSQKKVESGSSSYKAGLGVRLGYHYGITFKYMMSDAAAIEGILQFRYHGTAITGLYEKHAVAFDNDQFRWFYGIGGHVGYYGRNYGLAKKYYGRYYYEYEERPSIGIDGIIGLEYRIKEIPFTLGVDFKPYVDIYYPGWGYFDSALSVRYVF
jgi:hypothetical protein